MSTRWRWSQYHVWPPPSWYHCPTPPGYRSNKSLDVLLWNPFSIPPAARGTTFEDSVVEYDVDAPVYLSDPKGVRLGLDPGIWRVREGCWCCYWPGSHGGTCCVGPGVVPLEELPLKVNKAKDVRAIWSRDSIAYTITLPPPNLSTSLMHWGAKRMTSSVDTVSTITSPEEITGFIAKPYAPPVCQVLWQRRVTRSHSSTPM